MKKIITLLLLLIAFNLQSQVIGGSGLKKKPDFYIKIVSSSFVRNVVKDLERPCGNEIFITIEIDSDIPSFMGVPLRANHYIDGNLKDSLVLLGNSFRSLALGSSDISPYYDTISAVPDHNLKSKSKYAGLIFPEAIGPDDDPMAEVLKMINQKPTRKKIVIKAPFEPSPDNGPLKLNKYEFVIGDEFYDINNRKWVPDVSITNNIVSEVYYQRCGVNEKYLKPYPETYHEPVESVEAPKNKIIKSLFPTDQSLKPGKRLSLSIYQEYNGKPLDINKVQTFLTSLQGNISVNLLVKPKKVAGFQNQIIYYDLPLNFPTGAYVIEASYEGRIEGELFVVHK